MFAFVTVRYVSKTRAFSNHVFENEIKCSVVVLILARVRRRIREKYDGNHLNVHARIFFNPDWVGRLL